MPSGSETPDVEYTYGTTAPKVGKLTKVESSVSTTEYTTFDILGRVTASKQTTDGGAAGGYTSGYTYNLSGALIEQTYPSGRVVKNVIDDNGDLSLVQSKKNSTSGYWNYASSFTYNAAGAVTSMQLGNGRWESTEFNSRLQPTQIALGATQGATNLLDLDYSYGTTANNGNVMSQTNTVPTLAHPFVQNYTYDSLNRIANAIETSNATQTWKQTFVYDRYGNRRFDESNTTMPVSFTNGALTNPTISTSTNRLTSTGWEYDSSGNTTDDPDDREFIYDAENKQVKVLDDQDEPIGEYFYDGDGRRVKKVVPPTGETTIFVYDASGKLIEEYSTIVETTNAKVGYLTNDHLGSPRINTDANGAVTSRHDFHPFGEEIATSQRTAGLGYIDDTVRKQFTGYERDDETGLDFAEARYFSSTTGRFMVVDPIYLTLERIVDPQRLNLYCYVKNNPLIFVDPSGRDLSVAGNTTAAVAILQKILGTDDAAERITFDPKKGLSINLEGLDKAKNEGAKLLADLKDSKKKYQFSVGDTVETSEGTVAVGDIENLPADNVAGKPKTGIDGVVAIDPKRDEMISSSDKSLKVPQLWTTAFHELAESFEKVDNGKKYVDAHAAANNREESMRAQRPALSGHIPGGGGPALHIDGGKLRKHVKAVTKRLSKKD